MFLIVGLGNPGKQYQNTWHSLGFLAIDNFQSQMPDFSDWKNFDRARSLISEGEINGEKIILAKPQTFMNQSGGAVKSLILNHRNKIAMAELLRRLIIIHDDADLPVGKIKVSRDAGAAGHKGAESIINALKTKNFTRIRLGCRPENYIPGSKSLEKFVLKKFSKTEQKIVSEVLKKTAEIILCETPLRTMK